MYDSRRLFSVLALALVVTAGACEKAPRAVETAADAHAPAILELSPSKDDALVYVDGALAGTADRATPLVLRTTAGPHALRVSASGGPDLFGALDLAGGMRTAVRATLPTSDLPPVPDGLVHPVGVGQTLRLAFPAAAAPGDPWRFRLPGKKNEKVMLVVAERGAPIDIAVMKDGDDQRLPLALIRDTEGLDGRDFAEFTFAAEGTVRLEIRAAPGEVMNRVVLRIAKAPPPMVRDAKKVGRRLPPPEAK